MPFGLDLGQVLNHGILGGLAAPLTHFGQAVTAFAIGDHSVDAGSHAVSSGADAHPCAAGACSAPGAHSAEAPPAVDYSRDPASWGPAMWRSLHCIAHHLPPKMSGDSQHTFKSLVETLPSLLPCKVCGQHLTQHLREDPITGHLDTRDHVEAWLVKLHNKVNAETGKPALSHEEAMGSITGQCGESPSASELQQENAAAHDAAIQALQTGMGPLVRQAVAQASANWFLGLVGPPSLRFRTQTLALDSQVARDRRRHADFFPVANL